MMFCCAEWDTNARRRFCNSSCSLTCRVVSQNIMQPTVLLSTGTLLINKYIYSKFSRYLLGITKLDRERNQSVRGKLGVHIIVLEIKQ
jgi:hypothetical protein